MAIRKPLVQVGGEVQELPAGDTIAPDALELKTVDGQSIQGTGNITISGGTATDTMSPFLLMGA